MIINNSLQWLSLLVPNHTIFIFKVCIWLVSFLILKPSSYISLHILFHVTHYLSIILWATPYKTCHHTFYCLNNTIQKVIYIYYVYWDITHYISCLAIKNKIDFHLTSFPLILLTSGSKYFNFTPLYIRPPKYVNKSSPFDHPINCHIYIILHVFIVCDM